MLALPPVVSAMVASFMPRRDKRQFANDSVYFEVPLSELPLPVPPVDNGPLPDAAPLAVPVPAPVFGLPVPGMPTSGIPAVPGPPDVLPVLGAFGSGMVVVAPDDAPLEPVSPVVPGIAPRPGAPDVAVPTEPEPDVDGRSAPLVISSLLLPDDAPELLPVSLPLAPLLDAPLLLPSLPTSAPGIWLPLVLDSMVLEDPAAVAPLVPEDELPAKALEPRTAKRAADATTAPTLFVI